MYELTELYETNHETFSDEKAAYKVAILIARHQTLYEDWENPNDHLGTTWGIPFINKVEAAT